MPDVDVTSETLVARPRDEVAAYAADPDNVPAWYVNSAEGPFPMETAYTWEAVDDRTTA